MSKPTYYPETPGGTVLTWLGADTEDQAWANLLKDAAHMPYQGIEGFKERGYQVNRWTPVPQPKPKPKKRKR